MSDHLTEWSPIPDQAVDQAIAAFDLKILGWQGFEQLPWVRQMHTKYPCLHRLAMETSAIHGIKLDAIVEQLSGAEEADRAAIVNYFLAKLALEELSCRLNGAGAGQCDKRTAFLEIFKHLQNSR